MGLCRRDLVKDPEFGSHPGLSRWAQWISGSSEEGRRGVRAREGHTMIEAEAVLKQGLETGLDKPEDVFCPGPPEGTCPADTDCSDFGVLFPWGITQQLARDEDRGHLADRCSPDKVECGQCLAQTFGPRLTHGLTAATPRALEGREGRKVTAMPIPAPPHPQEGAVGPRRGDQATPTSSHSDPYLDDNTTFICI